MTPERKNQIAGTAETLWEDFEQTYVGVTPLSLLKQFPTSLRTVRDFFRFCAVIYAAADAQSQVIATVVEQGLSNHLAATNDERAASWLASIVDSAGIECPTVLIDTSCLSESLPADAAFRARCHLVLHEIGHLVLHWDQIRGFPTVLKRELAKKATPVQEEEAWWFCYALLGHVVSKAAKENKTDPKYADDQVWRLLMR